MLTPMIKKPEELSMLQTVKNNWITVLTLLFSFFMPCPLKSSIYTYFNKLKIGMKKPDKP